MSNISDKPSEVGASQGAEIVPEKSDAAAQMTPIPAQAKPSLLPLAGLLSLLGALAIYLLRLDRVVGLFVDDGWYVLLAKSLATGQGYSLINSPTPGILPLYPPAFPFLLSLVYRLSPDFPDNVWLLKSVSIVAMLGAGIVAYRYFTRDRALPPYSALGITIAAVLSPPIVFFATSTVMSECVFTFNLLLTIVMIERCVSARQSKKALPYAALGGALASAAFLTRSISLGLVAAAFVYLLKERLVKPALMFAAVVALLTAPWIIHTRLHAPTLEQRKEQGGHIVLPYTEQFWQKRAGNPGAGQAGIGDLPARVWNNLVEVGTIDVARSVMTPVVEALLDPGEAAKDVEMRGRGYWSIWLLSLCLSVLAIAGLVSAVRERLTLAEIAIPFLLVITALWPWQPFRLILPLLPFILFYVLVGLRSAARLWRWGDSQSQARLAAPVVVWCLAAISVYGNVNYLFKKYDSSILGGIGWVNIFEEAEEMFKRAGLEAPKDAAISASNPPIVHLYTGRKTISTNDPVGNLENWKRLGVRYMMSVAVFPDSANPAESGYKIVYRSRRHPDFWIVDLGPPDARAR